MVKHRALITGITGQDGSYLAELLLQKGYEVHGIRRRVSSFNTQRIDHLPLTLHHGDLTDTPSLMRVMQDVRPAEIYHLAAQSHVHVSFEEPEYTAQADAVGTLRLLEAVRLLNLPARVYNASTSEIFGASPPPQSEKTPFHPRSPYGCAKLYAHWIAVNYRESYGLWVANGIMFNHESPRRGETFVTRKITRALCRLLKGLTKEPLLLGNLYAVRDWGHARDYVSAMHAMLQAEKPDDYVIATGTSYTVREFVDEASRALGRELEWKGDAAYWGSLLVVKQDDKYLRPAEVPFLHGDARKARKVLGWAPETSFPQLVREMVEADLSHV